MPSVNDHVLLVIQTPCVCHVLKCMCKANKCTSYFNGRESGVFQWSKNIAVADEVGWEFVLQYTTGHVSFTSFVNAQTIRYRRPNNASAPFMCVSTFLDWFYNWVIALDYDFRCTGDPCQDMGCEELVVVFDGTHRGPLKKYVEKAKDRVIIEKPTLDHVQKQFHNKNTRCFLPYDSMKTDTLGNTLRLHLQMLCNTALKKRKATGLAKEMNHALLNRHKDMRYKNAIDSIIKESLPASVLKPLRKLLKGLLTRVPLLAFFPWRRRSVFRKHYTDLLDETKNDNEIKAIIEDLVQDQPEIAAVIMSAINEGTRSRSIIINFILFLLDEMERIHEKDPPYPPASRIKGSYDPSKGLAYHFTPHSEEVRQNSKYEAQKAQGSIHDDDHDDENPNSGKCTKEYPTVGRGGFCMIQAACCALHGFCIGWHVIHNGEGPKDAFMAAFKFAECPPKCAVYDNACHLHQYGLNREPGFAREMDCKLDGFHARGHKDCGYCYWTKRLKGFKPYNTSACEQLNAYLLKLKYTASHMTLPHFSLFMQFSLHLYNIKKRVHYENELEKAVKACETAESRAKACKDHSMYRKPDTPVTPETFAVKMDAPTTSNMPAESVDVQSDVPIPTTFDTPVEDDLPIECQFGEDIPSVTDISHEEDVDDLDEPDIPTEMSVPPDVDIPDEAGLFDDPTQERNDMDCDISIAEMDWNDHSLVTN